MGHILIVLSALFFSLSSYFGKIVTNTTDMSGVITSFSRFLIGTIMMFLYILISKKSFKANDFKPMQEGQYSIALQLYYCHRH